MRRFRMTIVLAFATFLSISICSAQQTATTSVPNLVRYSGTLKDAQGAASVPSTTVGVTFSIYKQQDGGAAIWQETQNVTPDANGQYNVVLGSTTATGLPDDLFLQQEQRWLGVQVQGEAEQARVLLVSVPYAFKAHEAETLGGLPASAFVKASPSDGSASTGTDTGTAVNALTTAGNTNIGSKGKSAALPNTICGSLTANGSANFVPLFGPTVCNLVNSTIYQLGSNVGIGIKTPSTALEVNGAITADQWYDITTSEIPFLSIGWPGAPLPGNQNTWLGLYAGGQGTVNVADSGTANTFVGYQAGTANTTGNFNSFLGVGAGQSNDKGVFNAFFGIYAGNSNTGPTVPIPTGGSYNAFFGGSSGLVNTTGYFNAFFGYRSGFGNSTGDSDTCIGYQTCYSGNASNNTMVGRSTGFLSRGNNNTFVGTNAGYNNNADSNTFVGYQAGTSNTRGFQNAFFGAQAGFNNLTGHANTFSGVGAGYQHIDGDQNTFNGTSAGFNDYHGKANTFIGASSGQTNGSGQYNTYLGVAAGLAAVGNENTYAGYAAGWGATNALKNTGSRNTFIGEYAGAGNTSGDENTFIGYLAGKNNNIGRFNLYLTHPGVAGDNSTIRIGNPAVHSALTYISGVWKTPISNSEFVVIDVSGHLGTTPGGGGVGPCALGQNYLTKWTIGTPSTTVGCSRIWENPAGINQYFVGIGPTFQSGTPNPNRQLQVDGDIDEFDIGASTGHYQIAGNTVLSIDPLVIKDNLFVGVGACSFVTNPGNTCVGSHAGGGATNTGISNTLVGFNAGLANTIGQDNTFVGRSAGVNNKGGTGNIFIGASAGSNQGAGGLPGGSEDIYIGNLGLAGQNETGVIRLGDPTNQTTTFIAGIFPNSPVGLTTYTVCIDSASQLYSAPAGGNCLPSSRRFKEQITDMGDRSSKLFRLRPVTFFYKPQSDDGSHLLQYGLIAEEVAKVYPELVAYEKDGTPYTVKYQLLAPMLLNELQKQHTIVAAQQDVIKTQQQQINDLQQRLSRLEMLVDSAVRATQQQPVAAMRNSGLR